MPCDESWPNSASMTRTLPTRSYGHAGHRSGGSASSNRPIECARYSLPTLSSLLFFGRRLVRLRRAWADGVVTPVVCRETVAELLRVLAYPKFRLNIADREVLLGDYLPFAEVVRLPTPLPELPLACRDDDDAVFLHLTIVSHADWLVSGDDDLLALSGAYPIISLTALQQRLPKTS